jgi:hypothetical protein
MYRQEVELPARLLDVYQGTAIFDMAVRKAMMK